jgi:hypothetical protein
MSGDALSATAHWKDFVTVIFLQWRPFARKPGRIFVHCIEMLHAAGEESQNI